MQPDNTSQQIDPTVLIAIERSVAYEMLPLPAFYFIYLDCHVFKGNRDELSSYLHRIVQELTLEHAKNHRYLLLGDMSIEIQHRLRTTVLKGFNIPASWCIDYKYCRGNLKGELYVPNDNYKEKRGQAATLVVPDNAFIVECPVIII